MRCVLSSKHLRNLKRSEYTDNPLVGANGKPLQPMFTIECTITLGSPALSVQCTFVVVQDLPFSCIIGESTLLGFNSWKISNTDKLLTINDTCVVPWYHHDSMVKVDHLNLITTGKTIVPPKQSVLVNTRACGPELLPFRAVTNLCALVESNTKTTDRLGIEICPSLHVLPHQNCSQQIKIYNNSSVTKVISKGTNIGTCTGFDECAVENGKLSIEENNILSINTSDLDPIDILCAQIKDLSKSEMVEVRKLLTKYKDLFSVSNDRIGETNITEFDIDVDKIPIVATPLRRVPLHHYDIIKELIAKYKDLGLIERIDSPFRASTVLVTKKNVSDAGDITDQYRLCTDYRQLNKHLTSPGWPSPSLQQCLDATSDSTIFSSIDFNSGYHQIPCTERAKEALAFSPGYGFPQLTWSRMPQGIKPASNVFQRTMSYTFKDHEECILPPFFDDVVIKGKDFKHHLGNVEKILNDIRAANLTLNVFKCFFFQKKLKYLGHIITNRTISLDPDRIEAIKNIPAPTSVKTLRKFIGMIQFCSDFCEKLNIILAPLYDNLKKKKPFEWSPACQEAFSKVKEILCTAPVLYTPSKCDKLVLETDACDIGAGGCLKAYDNNNKLIGVVGYCSKKFKEAEINWHIIEKEAFAIVHGTTHFKHYLIGGKFTIKCDNRVVTYIQDKQDLKNKKLLNWALTLCEFDFDIIHIPSKNNKISDYLSRFHVMATTDEDIGNYDTVDSEIKLCQQKDSWCKAATEYVKNKKHFEVDRLGEFKSFRKQLNIQDGVLCWKDKYVVPQSLRGKILYLCHDHPASGHYAVQRTLDRFKDKFFWPKALLDVDNWIKSCQKCNSFNIPRPGYTKCSLQPIETDHRFQLVCYDLAGPFIPTSSQGNKYVLIIVDHFTHWVELIALRDIKAITIAMMLFEQWCCRYGIPERFHSDGARNVHGNIMKELSRYLGVEKSKSSRLHPEGDGMAEAFVKQTKSCIQKQVDENGVNWDLFLQPTAFAIRSNIAHHTQLSPAELIIGSKLRQPVDSILPSKAKSFKHGQAMQFADNLCDRIKKCTNTVSSNLKKSRENMKRSYDKNARKHTFNVGDLVMLWKPYKKPKLSQCFQPNWDGPWKIVEFTGKTNCKIKKDNHELNVHINQLKHSSSRNPSLEYVNIRTEPMNITFNDYIEDFFDDECQQLDTGAQPIIQDEALDDTIPYEIDVSQNIENNDVSTDIIDQRWVSIDQRNILPGPRTRGLR